MILAQARHDRKAGRRVKVLAVREIGIIVNGATGRIASTQHLANALPIRAEGGLAVGDDRVIPHLLLAGRDEGRLAALARSNGVDRWTTDLDGALSDPGFSILFDAAATNQRVSTLTKAIAAGKHIYSEKPVALSVAEGMSLLTAVRARNLKHGAVEDKIFLPGLQKLSQLGAEILPARVSSDFGWWVFDGSSARAKGRAGTTSEAVLAGSPWICIPIGGTSSKAFSARSGASWPPLRRPFHSARTKAPPVMTSTSTIRP
jgi:hypothetical protein